MKTRAALKAFKACPECKCTILLKFDDDYLCNDCPWDTFRMSVEAGLFDDFFYQAERAHKNQEHNRSIEILGAAFTRPLSA
jgi:hypothetical protein